MIVRVCRTVCLGVLVCASAAGPARAAAPAGCQLGAEIRAARAAFGSASSVRELRAAGSVETSGMRGTGEIDEDLTGGRNAQRFRIPIQGDSATVYDGATRWQQDISGGVHPLDAPFVRELAVTDAYLARRGYLDASDSANLQCLGLRKTDGRTLLTIRVLPRGGQPAVLAFDPYTHLLWSTSERLPTTTQVTRYGDYRETGGLVLPFVVRSGTLSEPDDGFVFNVRRYALLDRARPGDFVKPRETDAVRMLDGVVSTRVPVALEGRQLIVWASIDGHAPMPFIFDSGGHAILTAGAARTLGLRASGAGVSGGSGAGTIGVQYVKVARVRIGKAELRDQHFLVIDYPYSFYERGRKPPLAGILGLEFFERFAAHIDYGGRTLTLVPLKSFIDTARGVPVRMRFQEDLPLVRAAADGHAGEFGVDTGNAGSLILFGPFVDRTGLDERYRSGSLAIGHGTGGTNTGRFENLREFSVGGLNLHGVRTDFTHMTSGSFSSWTEAGNFGYSVLSHYSPTFDYANQTVYLQPHARAPAEIVNRAGFSFEKNGPNAFD
ncbi:MAG TPA: retropepsin-like aspartic protease, partial [Candidatus Tumulicola sp.]